MDSTQLHVELPPTISSDDARLLLAVKLYEVGKVSLGQGAEIAELSIREFMAALGNQQIPVINYPPEDLRVELGL
jgi:predicted HTH domain antitoxin